MRHLKFLEERLAIGNDRKAKSKNKEWFDDNCKSAKREFTNARDIFNRVKNDQTRINFTRDRTKYNHMKKKAQPKI